MSTPTPEPGQPDPSLPQPPSQPLFGGPEPSDGPASGATAGSTAASTPGPVPTAPAGSGAELPPASPIIEGRGGDAGDSGGGGRRKGLIAGAAVAAVVLVGGGGALAYQSVMGGGGAQPESALPASTVAFVKVDLDPSSGQKVDAIRFLRKFPQAREQITGEDADLREVVFSSIQDEGVLQDVDYATEIEPWLGQRFAVGVVPGADGAQPTVAVALAVSDEGQAKDSIAKLSDSAEASCEVGSDYAVCAQDDESLARVLDETDAGTLADSDGFSSDMADLGEDGIATAWGDLSATKDLIQSAVDASGAPVEVPPGQLDQLGGRATMALRFDGTTLELAGRVTDLPDAAQVSGDDTASVDDLPADTLAAVSAGGVGAQVEKMWPQLLEQAGGADLVQDQLDALESQFDLTLPDDLVAALGSRLSIAFGGLGDDGMPLVALTTDGDRAVLGKIVDDVVPQVLGGVGESPLALTEDGDDTVLSLGADYGQQVADGSGLADSEAFKAVVPDADGARLVAYADIAALLESVGSLGMGPDAAEDEALSALSAFGMSGTADGDTSEFTIRLSTK